MLNVSGFHNIIIADSQFLVVPALKSLIDSTEHYYLAGVAWNQQELNEILGRTRQGLLIFDYAAVGFGGIATLKVLREKYPEVIVLILTNSINKDDFSQFSILGIRNVLYKTAEMEELLYAIESAIKGKKNYSNEILEQFLMVNQNSSGMEESGILTNSEMEIVKLVVEGLTTREIAVRRNISHHTVNAHRKNIFRKAEVANTSELIMHAIKAGWIDNIEYYI